MEPRRLRGDLHAAVTDVPWSGLKALIGAAFAGWLLAAGQCVAAWVPDTVRIGRLSLAYDEWTVALSRLQLERRAGAPLALSIDRIEGPAGVAPLWASLRLDPRSMGWRLDGVVASGRGELVLRFNGVGSGGTPMVFAGPM